MSTSDFSRSILVEQSPKQVFDALNNVRGWWSEEIEGSTEKLNDEFTYQFKDIHYCQIKIIESRLNERVVWLVKYNYFKFTKDKSEWTGTTISFDISQKADKTELRFTHHGLNEEYECFDICSNAWSQYIQQSLWSLVTTGKGQPNSNDKPVTEDERRLTSEA